MSSLKDIPIKVEHGKASPPPNGETSLYASSKKVYPRSVTGLFNNWRVLFVIGTQLVFFVVPWLNWNGRQAVLFDLANRKFLIFGLTIWPQDLIYLAALLIICAFGLFAWTTVAGRLWCGYSCPQTVYTEIMLWIEKWVEGDRAKRMKLDSEPLSLRKLRLKVTKHTLMAAVCLWVGFTFVGWFTPIRGMVADLPGLNYSGWELFWILFYGSFTWLFAVQMREQVCKYMCPYARFQSVMFDADTLIISYDTARGEPRGSRKKSVVPSEVGLGSCIDCTLCVQVCPTGIDIRDGLQIECIGCAACIDVCDDVMDKMGYARGLIRYTTENALEGKYPEREIWAHLKRPRVVMYGMILLVAIGATIGALLLRKPIKVEVLRDRASLVQETTNGWLENSYSIKISNISDQDAHYRLSVRGLPLLKLKTDTPVVTVKGGSIGTVPVRVDALPDYATRGSHPIEFVIQSVEQPDVSVAEKSSFIGE
jgi:cytochrome c oxidase accessory protein FixG